MITLVTGNKFKAEETKRIIKVPLVIKDLDLDEIQEIDVEKVALHKLRQAYEIVQSPVIIDDISFEVNAWNSFPGPLIKWILKAGGPELLLKMLQSEVDKSASAKLAIGYKDKDIEKIFIGSVEGMVADKARGENGFGWDKVFIPNGFTKTFAEMEADEKDSISHRGIALEKLNDFLKKEIAV